MSGAKIIEGLRQARDGQLSRVEIGGEAWMRVDSRTRHAVNSAAWALGYHGRNGFHVRRVVWGRALAREEKREGENIRRATILITRPR